jgi:hypothetical protein
MSGMPPLRPFNRHGAIALAFLVALVAAPAAAQIPQKPENLRYFPKDITRDSLVQIMRGFSFALGARCQYCHAGGDGISFEGVSFPSDEKITKQKARYMLQMMDTINTRLLALVPGRSDPPIRIECNTCHRGLTRPASLADVLTATIEKKGIDSAVAQYRNLRTNLMYTGRYDFGEWSINEMARHLATDGKTAEAITMLRLNQEFNAQSTSIDLMIAEIHLTRGEKDDAIARFRAVLKKAPNDQTAKRRLKELGVEP